MTTTDPIPAASAVGSLSPRHSGLLHRSFSASTFSASSRCGDKGFLAMSLEAGGLPAAVDLKIKLVS